MRILIAPNAFKGSLNAEAVAFAIEQGLLQSQLRCTCECFPVADGGDGTAELIINKFNGQHVYSEVTDPGGRKIKASFGLIQNGSTAVIEMANASGVKLLKEGELNPLRATSFGTGEQIKLALEKGAKKIIVGMGGSATVDGGCGILQALGVKFLDAAGNPLKGLPASLVHLENIDDAGLDRRIFDCTVFVLCDVDNAMLGDEGAAAVFGPQKGATPEQVTLLEAGLQQFSVVTKRHTNHDIAAMKRGGAAGGAAAGLYAFIGARLMNGIDYFLEVTGFDEALERCELVVTGEGCIDQQTLQGKGPFGVARKAKSKGVPVIGLAGKVPLQKNDGLQHYFNALLSIGHEPFDLETAMTLTPDNLKRTAGEIGGLLALGAAFQS